ncbi:hypothetical protein L2744_04335 [Shewanella profunda]|uniref:hypothetical protein n=1 Tax=Shewanella profunda TaxID=254793 RepID=UPI00200BAC44|nr:hypothetical protein [Shewanella profunda]MCL1088847.1 hypothetical protein [Shewanella profunda]
MAERINLSISERKLAQLIRDGYVCAADFSCLDNQSKQKVWQLCLICCKKRIVCDQCVNLDCAQVENRINTKSI